VKLCRKLIKLKLIIILIKILRYHYIVFNSRHSNKIHKTRLIKQLKVNIINKNRIVEYMRMNQVKLY
jgi:hypothetical protein